MPGHRGFMGPAHSLLSGMQWVCQTHPQAAEGAWTATCRQRSTRPDRLLQRLKSLTIELQGSELLSCCAALGDTPSEAVARTPTMRPARAGAADFSMMISLLSHRLTVSEFKRELIAGLEAA